MIKIFTRRPPGKFAEVDKRECQAELAEAVIWIKDEILTINGSICPKTK